MNTLNKGSLLVFVKSKYSVIRTLLVHFVSSPSLLMLIATQLITVICGLIYGKILTTYIKPTQLGIFNIQATLSLSLIAIFISTSNQAFMTAYQRYGMQSTLPIYIRIITCFSVLILCIITSLYSLKLVGAWAFIAWLSGFCQSIYTFSLGVLQSSGRMKEHAAMQSIYSIATLVLLLLCLLVDIGTSSTALWMNMLGVNIILCVVAAILVNKIEPMYRFTWQINNILQRKIILSGFITYVSPLLGYACFSSLNNYADRYLLNYLTIPANVGYYTVAYSLGARVNLIGNPFLLNLSALMFALRRENRHTLANRLILKYLVMFWCLGLSVCSVLYLYQNEIGNLLLSTAYQPAFKLLPIIALASVAMMSFQLIETKFYVYGKTKFILYHSVMGAAVNLCLNWLLIPKYGITGAALATLISFSFQFVIMLIFAKTVKFY